MQTQVTSMFTMDLHIHSRFSYDSVLSPSAIARYASKRGMDALAITDHNSFEGVPAVEDIVTDSILVPGMEIRTREHDDILALFIDEPIYARNMEDVVVEIHNQGGLAVLPHPYRKLEPIPDWLLETVDGIEGLNARSKPGDNERARQLGLEFGLPKLGGSDAHTRWEIGRAYTVVERPVETRADLREAILEGAVRPGGQESPYLLSHGTSVTIETIKSGLGNLWTEM